MSSVPASRWRTFADYAGVTVEIAAAIVIGLMITMLVLALNPEIARGAQGDGTGRITGPAPSGEFRQP